MTYTVKYDENRSGGGLFDSKSKSTATTPLAGFNKIGNTTFAKTGYPFNNNVRPQCAAPTSALSASYMTAADIGVHTLTSLSNMAASLTVNGVALTADYTNLLTFALDTNIPNHPENLITAAVGAFGGATNDWGTNGREIYFIYNSNPRYKPLTIAYPRILTKTFGTDPNTYTVSYYGATLVVSGFDEDTCAPVNKLTLGINFSFDSRYEDIATVLPELTAEPNWGIPIKLETLLIPVTGATEDESAFQAATQAAFIELFGTEEEFGK